ncbi:hypothetical protein NNJEOMEG_03578 [Fundidesulfovibrio magnetotacticus]|uniref:HPt domain-containing protein n=1 Tax=Fundidesulfovibrio magnetotacticus TaxID=2730080 RepID=A0A6V8LY04_9BACT|nr:Hpt domain-containing protein [Fundidesulfovibrio magnetotacticus]GFK95710.1 hypothetical protein NNJEOMEG_03578 [Fundidesulfovibrio magnetotacticus]
MDESPYPASREPCPPFDLEERASRFAEIEDCLPELLAIFRSNGPADLSAIAKALDGQDLQAAANLCHTLKGMAAVVCAPVVARTASELESAARALDVPASRALLEELSRAMAQALDSPHCL